MFKSNQKGIIGFLGAKNKSRPLLTVYFSFLLGLLLLELIAIYFTISFQTRVKADLTDALNTTLTNSVQNRTVSRMAMSNIQTIFSCCGVTGPLDYASLNSTVPDACFTDQNREKQIYATGCSSTIFETVKDRIPIIAATLFFVIIIELVAMVCTIFVCSNPVASDLYDLF